MACLDDKELIIVNCGFPPISEADHVYIPLLKAGVEPADHCPACQTEQLQIMSPQYGDAGMRSLGWISWDDEKSDKKSDKKRKKKTGFLGF